MYIYIAITDIICYPFDFLWVLPIFYTIWILSSQTLTNIYFSRIITSRSWIKKKIYPLITNLFTSDRRPEWYTARPGHTGSIIAVLLSMGFSVSYTLHSFPNAVQPKHYNQYISTHVFNKLTHVSTKLDSRTWIDRMCQRGTAEPRVNMA